MSAPTIPNLQTGIRKIMDLVHDYKAYGRVPSQCRVRVFADPSAIGRLVKMAEVVSQPAPSIDVNLGQEVGLSTETSGPDLDKLNPAERMIVILSDMNVGVSVTNAADTIATEILPMLVPYPELRGHVLWIEHYADADERFALVSFTAYDANGPYHARNRWKSGYSGTQWRHITKSQVEELIGGKVGE
jgi:hypothetical protein